MKFGYDRENIKEEWFNKPTIEREHYIKKEKRKKEKLSTVAIKYSIQSPREKLTSLNFIIILSPGDLEALVMLLHLFSELPLCK